MVSWIGPQNQAGFDLSVAPQNRWEVAAAMGGCDGVGHTSKSSGLLHVKASLARISQSVFKTGAWKHVAPSRMLNQSQVEDGHVIMTGCIGPFYSTFTVFIMLGRMGSLVIKSFPLAYI
jgi:hypothetical protein